MFSPFCHSMKIEVIPEINFFEQLVVLIVAVIV
jgi:hypothetical protein